MSKRSRGNLLLRRLLIGVRLLLAIAFVWIATHLRTPLLVDVRSWAFWLVLALSLGWLLIELAIFRSSQSGKKRSQSSGLDLVSSIFLNLRDSSYSKLQVPKFKIQIGLDHLNLIIAFLVLLTVVGSEARFQWIKHRVLNADSQTLEKLGQHVIVGYRNFDEVKALVERKAIAGIYITGRNVEHKTQAAIQAEIRSLQTIRRSQALPPLWVAADQEGGIVSRLSPPLTALPPLSTVPTRQPEVIKYARVHGQGLSSLGVNLNFAPVVDLNQGVISPRDQFSRIYQRAISADPGVVAKVARWYCQTLEEYGVHCTAKHFPGLGSVQTDTHLESAELSKPVSELIREDWVPFRELMDHTQAIVMLGHAKLSAIDPHHPVSFSEAVIAKLIRNSWKYEGVLITDDFCMQAVYSSQSGLQGATVAALNAGVDLVLISFDSDLYYEAMNALLQAEQKKQLDDEQLKTSNKRLERNRAASSAFSIEQGSE
jgi:beta-N-acetylhexosaminidase